MNELYDEVDYFIFNWIRWLRKPDNQLGYQISKFIAISGSKSFDDMIVNLDEEHGLLVDTIINDLDKKYRDAINKVYLDVKVDLEGCNIDQLMDEAKVIIKRKLVEKNIL